MHYLSLKLSLKNIEIGESNTVEGADFLMEIMEINEKLSEVKSMSDLDAIRTSNNGKLFGLRPVSWPKSKAKRG